MQTCLVRDTPGVGLAIFPTAKPHHLVRLQGHGENFIPERCHASLPFAEFHALLFQMSIINASLPLDPFASWVFEQPGRRGSGEEAVQGWASIQLLVVAHHALKIEPPID